MCGLKITYNSPILTENDIKVSADKLDPFSQGAICPKSQALPALQFDKEKLRYPLAKIDGEFKEVSWDEAYDLVEKGIKKVRSKYGADSIASYLGNPIVHNLGMMLFIKTFTKSLGSKNIFSATSMDQLPHHFVSHFMFGHEMRIPVPDIDNTNYMIIMGANPIESNGSIMSSAGVKKRLKNITQNDGKVILIDPRKTETAKVASEHHYIQPEADMYFLLALLHICFRDEKTDLKHLKVFLKNIDKIKKISKELAPKKASQLTGIDEETIERVAKEFFDAPRAVIYGRLGVCTQSYGGLNQWLINLLNILSGNFDTKGGMMFPTPAIELVRDKKQTNIFGRWSSRVAGLKEFAGELPVSAMLSEFETEGEGQIKAFVTVCGNPVLSSPNGGRLDKALKNLEFMVSIDNYINETSRDADVILPTPSGLEIEHYDLIFNTISVNNNAKFSEALITPKNDRPYDWQVLKELSKRVNENGLSFIDRFMTPKRVINFGLLMGPYGKLSSPKRFFSGLNLQKLIDSKHGISLGSLKPSLPNSLITDDKKIDLAPDIFIKALKNALESEQKPPLDKNEFILIGRRNLLSTNTWMHQVQKLSSHKNTRCTALINKKDAEALGFKNAQNVSIKSDVGEIIIPLEITDNIMSGVISIPHGFGHNKPGTKISHAEANAGVSINNLIDNTRVDALTGNAALTGQRVSLNKEIKNEKI
jgi:anaerobic selenocysteine-containing dehydrogenase